MGLSLNKLCLRELQLPAPGRRCQGNRTEASLEEVTGDADHRQTKHFCVFCPLGLGQAGAPPYLTRVLQTQIMSVYFCLCTFLSTYHLQSISGMLTCKFSEVRLGLDMKNLTTFRILSTWIGEQGVPILPATFTGKHSRVSGILTEFSFPFAFTSSIICILCKCSWINFESTHWVLLGFLVKSHSLNISATLTVLIINILWLSQKRRH